MCVCVCERDFLNVCLFLSVFSLPLSSSTCPLVLPALSQSVPLSDHLPGHRAPLPSLSESVSVSACLSFFAHLTLSLACHLPLSLCAFLPAQLSLHLRLCVCLCSSPFLLVLLILLLPLSPGCPSMCPFPFLSVPRLLPLSPSFYSSVPRFLPASLSVFASPSLLAAVPLVFCLRFSPHLSILLPFPPSPKSFSFPKVQASLTHVHAPNFHCHTDFQFSLERDLRLTLNAFWLFNSSHWSDFMSNSVLFKKHYWVIIIF